MIAVLINFTDDFALLCVLMLTAPRPRAVTLMSFTRKESWLISSTVSPICKVSPRILPHLQLFHLLHPMPLKYPYQPRHQRLPDESCPAPLRSDQVCISISGSIYISTCLCRCLYLLLSEHHLALTRNFPVQYRPHHLYIHV